MKCCHLLSCFMISVIRPQAFPSQLHDRDLLRNSGGISATLFFMVCSTNRGVVYRMEDYEPKQRNSQLTTSTITLKSYCASGVNHVGRRSWRPSHACVHRMGNTLCNSMTEILGYGKVPTWKVSKNESYFTLGMGSEM